MAEPSNTFSQSDFDIRIEWGEQGVLTLAPASDVVIIVDVLSFTTSVDVAVSRGATVFPFRGPGEAAALFAFSRNALLAHRDRVVDGYSLSPASLMSIAAGERIVLPSPNGATLSLSAGETPVVAGCLRNARAAAQFARSIGSRIAVIAAGEHWRTDWSLRPSLEDLIGAGAVISYLTGTMSPEAASAVSVFRDAQRQLLQRLEQCGSGKELIALGFSHDVALAAQLNESTSAPVLRDGAFEKATS